jgi:GTPase SAR1 family protein
MPGCCGGGLGQRSAAQATRDAEIDAQMAANAKKLDKQVKILLLGAGDSGKSTVAKQMQIIHKGGYKKQRRVEFRSKVFKNVVDAIRSLIEGSGMLGIEISNTEAADRVMNSPIPDMDTDHLDSKLVQDIQDLWTGDAGIQAAYQRRSEFQLIDSCVYYFENLDRIGGANYVPSEQDILRSRTKTTGIIEIEFTLENIEFLMVDVGGQRSERKKWMSCFQDVTAVLFVVALSEFDQKLQEDETTMRMEESLKLFAEIVNNEWFKNTAMILFLNKKDLFEEKLKAGVSLKTMFPDFDGPDTWSSEADTEEAIRFVEDKFLAENEHPAKMVYVHPTCATDTNNVQAVFGAVKDSVLSNVLNG